MGLAYLFALVVGLGILLIQVVLGSKDTDGDGRFDKDVSVDADAHVDLDAHADLHADADADAHGDADHAHGSHAPDGGIGVASLFLSTRFWIFASLGFGLCGTLLHYALASAGALTFAVALAMGLASGLAAGFTFRALKRSAGQHAASVESAVARVGRVLVPVTRGNPGKVRIELQGQMVDMMARSDDEEIARGEAVVIHDIDGDTAYVTRVPREVGP